MNRKNFINFVTGAGVGIFSYPAIISGTTRLGQSENLIKPASLQYGDTIGLISPAGILDESDRYDEITETIKTLGFNVKEGRNARKQHRYFAGTDKERVNDLHSMFMDPEVKAIIPYRGGWGTARLLNYIDYDLIKKHPKILVGFSDITTLLLSIYAKTNVVTFHGPVGKSEWTDFTYSNFTQILMHATSSRLRVPEYESFYTIRSGKTSGKLIGGNLSIITSLLGSNHLPTFDDAILFVEDVGEEIYRIDRMLTQLKLSGILDSIRGFIFGKCTDCVPETDKSFTLNELLQDIIEPLGIPAFSGAMIGHTDNILTIPIGIEAEIDAESGLIHILEGAVSQR